MRPTIILPQNRLVTSIYELKGLKRNDHVADPTFVWTVPSLLLMYFFIFFPLLVMVHVHFPIKSNEIHEHGWYQILEINGLFSFALIY